VEAEREEVRELGGLYVLGSERHESRRIDNQLRGRSGRQGDPGESRFYLSMEDDLMRLFNSGMAQRIMASGAYPEDMPLENRLVSRSIASAQHQVEARNFEIRKNVLKYDDVMTGQRETIYAERRKVLEGEDMGPQLRSFAESLVTGLVDEAIAGKAVDEWDLPSLWENLRGYYPPSVSIEEVEEEHGGRNSLVRDDLVTELVGDIHAVYEDTEERLNENPLAQAQLGDEPMRTLERRVVISVVDRLWREHLYEMDYLKEGIGLRAMGQRDPLVEYKDEGAQMFQAMVERIREESVQQVFSYAKQFERALASAEEQAGGGAGRGAPQQVTNLAPDARHRHHHHEGDHQRRDDRRVTRREGIAVLSDQAVRLFGAGTLVQVLNHEAIRSREHNRRQDVERVHDLLDEPPDGGRDQQRQDDSALRIKQPGRARHERIHRGRA